MTILLFALYVMFGITMYLVASMLGKTEKERKVKFWQMMTFGLLWPCFVGAVILSEWLEEK